MMEKSATKIRQAPDALSLLLDYETLRETIEANPSTSSRRLFIEFDTSQKSTVWHFIKSTKDVVKYHMVWRKPKFNFVWKPDKSCFKIRRTSASSAELQSVLKSAFISITPINIINDGRTPNKWRNLWPNEINCCMFEGIIHFELGGNNRSIYADLYSAQFDQMLWSTVGSDVAWQRFKAICQRDEELDVIELLPYLARTLRHLIFIYSRWWHIICVDVWSFNTKINARTYDSL